MTATIAFAALLAVLVAIRFIIYCFDDIDRRDVQHLSKQTWRVIVCFFPLGTMFHIMMEKDSPRH